MISYQRLRERAYQFIISPRDEEPYLFNVVLRGNAILNVVNLLFELPQIIGISMQI